MEKIKLALGTKVVEPYLSKIKEVCEVTEVGSLAHKDKISEDDFIKECEGNEIVYIGADKVSDKCIEKWVNSGMKLIGCGRGTPVNVDWKAVKKYNVPLVYAPGRNANAVAEYVFGLLISLTRKISLNYHALQSGKHLAEEVDDILKDSGKKDVIWFFPDGSSPIYEYGGGMELYGKSIGIVGYGAIGKRVATIAKGFGMEVKAYDPYCQKELVEKDGVKYCELEETLKCNVVTIHLPVNSSTIGMVNKEWFDMMEPTTFFINTSRASVVDQSAMIQALENNKIAGAAVDVMWIEPCPANHPFLKMKNVIMTSHLAGQSKDVERWQSEMICSEILNYANKVEPKLVWKRVE